MIEELETIVLTRDIPEYALAAGDVGAVVHCCASGASYEVEFLTGEAKTLAVVTLSEADLRSNRRKGNSPRSGAVQRIR